MGISLGAVSQLLIDVGEMNPPWAVPSLGRWSWAIEESRVSEPYVATAFLHALCFGFGLQVSVWLWFSLMIDWNLGDEINPALSKLLIVSVLLQQQSEHHSNGASITATERAK